MLKRRIGTHFIETMRLRIRNKIRRFVLTYYPFMLGFLSAIIFDILVVWCEDNGELKLRYKWPLNSFIPLHFFTDETQLYQKSARNGALHQYHTEGTIDGAKGEIDLTNNVDNFTSSR